MTRKPMVLDQRSWFFLSILTCSWNGQNQSNLAWSFTVVPSYNRCPTTQIRQDMLLFRQPTKWDVLLADDDKDINDEDGNDTEFEYTAAPPDMTYEPRNVQRAHETFLAIREAGGVELTNDVYIRTPNEELFWYVGKVARVSDVSLEDCIQRQWAMIEHHATNLRPLEIYSFRGRLEIWTAPGDSELIVAYNRSTLQMKKHTKPKQYRPGDKPKIPARMVGFQGEVYESPQDGFKTWRTEDGRPAHPEINPGGETRPPTDEEYTQLRKRLKGMDVNDLYLEQERRMGRLVDEDDKAE